MTQLAAVGRVLPHGVVFVVAEGARFQGAPEDWITVEEYWGIVNARGTKTDTGATGCADYEARELFDNEEVSVIR